MRWPRNAAKTGFSVPFVNINCPAVPDTLIESELFGYRKGAFTGAVQNFSGKICLADNGVLFLDEIAEIPLKTQAKLLRFMEDKTFEPLGSTARIRVETRIICATNKDLAAMVREGLIPRGSLLPNQHDHDPHPPAPRTKGGHPAARRALPCAVVSHHRQADEGDF